MECKTNNFSVLNVKFLYLYMRDVTTLNIIFVKSSIYNSNFVNEKFSSMNIAKS